jgi:hypothetical protein
VAAAEAPEQLSGGPAIRDSKLKYFGPNNKTEATSASFFRFNC